nr:uncharacterized protein LOC129467557 [Symphalangus syndactylus]
MKVLSSPSPPSADCYLQGHSPGHLSGAFSPTQPLLQAAPLALVAALTLGPLSLLPQPNLRKLGSKQLQNSESKSAIFYIWKLAGLLLGFIAGGQPLTPPFAIGGGCPTPEALLPPAPPRGMPPATCPQPRESPQQRQPWEGAGWPRAAYPMALFLSLLPGKPGQHLLPDGQAVRTKPRSHSPPGNANESHKHGNGARGGTGALSPACRSAQRHASQNWVGLLGIQDRRASQMPGKFGGSSCSFQNVPGSLVLLSVCKCGPPA